MSSIVRKYPKPVKESYRLLKKRCVACHGLRTAIDTPYVLPSYLKEMVQRMADMPDSGISSEDANKIYEFLVYDAMHRRQKQLQEEIENLPQKQQAIEKQLLLQVESKYDKPKSQD